MCVLYILIQRQSSLPVSPLHHFLSPLAPPGEGVPADAVPAWGRRCAGGGDRWPVGRPVQPGGERGRHRFPCQLWP